MALEKRPAPTPGIISSFSELEGINFKTIIGSVTRWDDPPAKPGEPTPYLSAFSMHYWLLGKKEKDEQKPHFQDEVYVILEGEGQVDIDGKILDIRAGDIVFVPAQMNHHFITNGESDIRMLVFFGPDWCGRNP